MIALLAIALAGPSAEVDGYRLELVGPTSFELGDPIALAFERTKDGVPAPPCHLAGVTEVSGPEGVVARHPGFRLVPSPYRFSGCGPGAQRGPPPHPASFAVSVAQTFFVERPGTYTARVVSCTGDPDVWAEEDGREAAPAPPTLEVAVTFEVRLPASREAVLARSPVRGDRRVFFPLALPEYVPLLEALAWGSVGEETTSKWPADATDHPVAFYALAACACVEATAALVRLLDHPDPAVRTVVATLLSGRTPGFLRRVDPTLWDAPTTERTARWAHQQLLDGTGDAFLLRWMLASLDRPQPVDPALDVLSTAWTGPQAELRSTVWGVLRTPFDPEARTLAPASPAATLVRLAAHRADPQLDPGDEALLADLLGRVEEERVGVARLVLPTARHDGLIDDLAAAALRVGDASLCRDLVRRPEAWGASEAAPPDGCHR